MDDDTEELTSAFFSYRRHDNRHKCVAKTPTWQDGRETNIRVRNSDKLSYVHTFQELTVLQKTT